jgi:serine/threonine protein kinase/Tfp pilus assembly protein PilF
MIGKTVSHYKIIEKIGAGGMGEVYLAEDTKLKRKIALKFLPQHLTANDEAIERFKREAQSAATLNHPNIITIHEIGEHEGQTYIAMEYVEGETLRSKIKDYRLSKCNIDPDSSGEIKEIADITIQICEGLSKAHQAGIVHRDIKPENILINSDGQVKILDFGLAKLKGAGNLTKETSTLGTINYMSPEQAQGNEVDQQTDIWSLGVVLYEMLSGELPFKGEYEHAVIYSILNEEPQSNMDINQKLEEIIKKCLAKKLENRYQNTDELKADLLNLNKKSEKSATTNEVSVKNRYKSFIIPVTLFLFLIMIITGYFIFFRTDVFERKNNSLNEWKNSIAVLPFDDLSQNKDQDHFCMGMTEQVLSNLAKLNELKVIARTSVMKYKDTQKSISEISEELDVRNILAGSIQRAGDRIRITVKLINATTGAYLWSENYDSDLQDLFSVQDNVSKSVADVLNIKLKILEFNDEKKYETKNTEAHEYCLKGEFYSRYFILTKKLDDHRPLFLKAEEYFKKSLELDPSYARAKLGLAEHYLSFYFLHGDNEFMDTALEYATEIIAFDPKNVFAIALKGGYYYEMEEFETAFSYLKQALQLNPHAGKANYYMALFYDSKGLYYQSKRHLERAVQVDPLNTLYLHYYGVNLQDLGLFDESEKIFRKLLEFDPNHVLGRWMLFWNNLYTNNFDAAVKIFEEHLKLFPNFQLNNFAKAKIHAIKGKKEQVFAFGDTSVFNYLLLNMDEEAIQLLEKQSKEGSYSYYLIMKLHPWYGAIRSDPRFIEILAQRKEVYEINLRKYEYVE